MSDVPRAPCAEACLRCCANSAEAERAAVVRYLREQSADGEAYCSMSPHDAAKVWADAIESGDHLKETP